MLKVPAGQSSHDAEPKLALNVPEEQAVHDTPLAPLNPWLHSQCVGDELPAELRWSAGHAVHTSDVVAPDTVENCPEAHSSHCADPVTSLKLPGRHSVQFVPALNPVKPVLQTQASGAVLPGGLCEEHGQGVHVEDITAAKAVL